MQPARPDLVIQRIRGPVTDTQLASILEAWNAVYPVQLHMEPEALRAFIDQDESAVQYLSDNADGRMQGWGLCFERDGDRWFSLLVIEDRQGQGIGSAILRAMQSDEAELNGWVIDHGRDKLSSGKPYRSPLPFYRRLGFTICHDTRWEDHRISAAKIRWQRSPGP